MEPDADLLTAALSYKSILYQLKNPFLNIRVLLLGKPANKDLRVR